MSFNPRPAGLGGAAIPAQAGIAIAGPSIFPLLSATVCVDPGGAVSGFPVDPGFPLSELAPGPGFLI